MRTYWLAATVGVAAAVLVPGAATGQWPYYPHAPVHPPYYPPLNYGPGNHFPAPFKPYYLDHPYAHLYYPYTYLPYSAYYHYPTLQVYRDSYNPYAPPPGLRIPGFYPALGEIIKLPVGEDIPAPRPDLPPADSRPK